MRKTIFKSMSATLIALFMLSCGTKTNAQNEQNDKDSIRIYGIKSGYFKTEMPTAESISETWFDHFGNLQYVEISTKGDKYKSCKLVRYNEEYFFSTFNKEGKKRKVEYIDYRDWTNPSKEEMAAQGLSKLPTLMMFGKACKTFHMNGYIPSIMSVWNGILMKNVTDDGETLSEVVDIRETAVSSTMFNIPENIHFVEEIVNADSISAE